MQLSFARHIRTATILSLAAVLCFASANARTQIPRAETVGERAFLLKLSAAAIERTHHRVRYDPAYVRIPYPGGDVPSDTGVCTDEVIRSYRVLGIDLQKEVHEDIVRNLTAYPLHSHFGTNMPDTNIDHRRVPNLMVFFRRKGESLPTTNQSEDYSPGDIVAWDLGGGILHIGIVVDRRAPHSGRYMVVHNIGARPADAGRSLRLENYRPLPLFRVVTELIR